MGERRCNAEHERGPQHPGQQWSASLAGNCQDISHIFIQKGTVCIWPRLFDKLLEIFWTQSMALHKSTFQNLQSEHGGEYACRASNHLTRETHLSPHPITLTVLPEGELHKPRLLAEPEKEYHAVQGEDITLPCSASGSPKPTVMWEHEVFNQQPVPLYQQGPSELLHLTNLTANSSGTYSCKIWSSRGRRILRKTVVYVAEKPEANIRSFSDGPFKEGGPLELYCQAEGFPAPEVG